MTSASTLTITMTLAISALIGCGSPNEAPDAGPEAVELGTGTIAFERLVDEQDLTLVAGIQGGYHFVVHARIQSLLPGDPSRPGQLGNPITTFFIFREDGTRIDTQAPPYRLGYREADDGWYELPSGRILQVSQELIESEGLVPAIYNERVRLRIEVRDVQGKRAAAERWIRPQEQTTIDAGPSEIDSGFEIVDAGIATDSMPMAH